jgi:hypothetical protein
MVCMEGTSPTVHLFPHPLADLPHLPCEESVVQGHYNDTIAATGWSFLTLEGNSNHTDEHIAAAAGLLEGALTAHRIAQHIGNIRRGSSTGFPPLMTAFSTMKKWQPARISGNSMRMLWISGNSPG